MKLIPEQISYLRRQQRELKETIESYQDYLGQRETTSSDYSSRALIGDTLIDQQYQRAQDSYQEVTSLLERSEYVMEKDLETIQIGTKFIVEFDNMPSTNAIILTDEMFSLIGEKRFVSAASPLGKSVIGKHEGDRIQYILPGTTRTGKKVTGTIKEIKKQDTDYLQFIRSKNIKYRMATVPKRELHELKNALDEEKQEEYRRRHEITESQKQLLLIDLEMTSKLPKTKATIARIANINKILESSQIAQTPIDGTIGIGSTFDVIITDGQETEEKHYEMINYAVTTELEDEYIERISALGSKLFGLRQNEQVSFIKGNKTYKALITNVNVSEKDKARQYHK